MQPIEKIQRQGAAIWKKVQMRNAAQRTENIRETKTGKECRDD